MQSFLQLLREHLQYHNIYNNNHPWIIKSCSNGRGLFANRDIQPGEIIFKDSPLLIGPRANKIIEILCTNCYKSEDLYACSKKCGLPVCSKICENSSLHQKECRLILKWNNGREFSKVNQELFKCLTPIRALFLNESQSKLLKVLKFHEGPGYEVGILENMCFEITTDEKKILNLICSILDTNSFEVIAGCAKKTISLRGLYPLGSLMNHKCVPNTTHYFDSNQNMIFKASTFIPKNKEIFHTYTMLFWGTVIRKPYLLRSKHFSCTCNRCQDPTECGTNLSAINCLKCKGIVLPIYDKSMTWKCSCNETMSTEKVGIIMTMLGHRLDSLETSDPEEVLHFLKGPLLKYAPACSQIGVQLKCNLFWKLGLKQKYLWTELSTELLDEKETICRELLELLEKLRVGRSKMRGLVLYELYSCLLERQKRLTLQGTDENNTENISQKMSKEMEEYFVESRDILTGDVHAPEEIKQYNLIHKEKLVPNDEISLAG